MLAPANVTERLKGFADPASEDRRLARVAALPMKLRSVGYAMLGRDESGGIPQKSTSTYNWMESYQGYSDEQVKQCAKITEWSEAERIRFFSAIHPALGAELNSAWDWLPQTPYPAVEGRYGFRAPTVPGLCLTSRCRLISSTLRLLKHYDQDVTWLAAWLPYLPVAEAYGPKPPELLWPLLAVALNRNDAVGNDVYQTLVDSGAGVHEIGAMGRHVVSALLSSNRPEGWEFIAKLLVAAERQEGLRQVILENADDGHLKAFRTILQVLIDHNMCRFSSVVRAADEWFGFGWEATDSKAVHSALVELTTYMDSAALCRSVIATLGNQSLYLALYFAALENAVTARISCQAMLTDPKLERRYVAITMIERIGLRVPAPQPAITEATDAGSGLFLWVRGLVSRAAVKSSANADKPAVVLPTLIDVLDDPDLRIASSAFRMMPGYQAMPAEYDWFDHAKTFLDRVPDKETVLEPIIWPWTSGTIDRKSMLGIAVTSMASTSPEKLLPYLGSMDSNAQRAMVRGLCDKKEWSSEIRRAMIDMLVDRSEDIRTRIVNELLKRNLALEDFAHFERLAITATASTRRVLLILLGAQTGDQPVESALRIAAAGTKSALPALLLLQYLHDDPHLNDLRIQAAKQIESTSKLSKEARAIYEEIVASTEVEESAYGLGLYRDSERTPGLKPKYFDRRYLSSSSAECYKACHQIFKSLHETQVTVTGGFGNSTQMVGELEEMTDPAEDAVGDYSARMSGAFDSWYRSRGPECRDSDGLELVRLYVYALSMGAQDYNRRQDAGSEIALRAIEKFVGKHTGPVPHYSNPLEYQIIELAKRRAPAASIDFVLDAIESCCNAWSYIPELLTGEYLRSNSENYGSQSWRGDAALVVWHRVALSLLKDRRADWSDEQISRFWGLCRWLDEPVAGAPRHISPERVVLWAFACGAANSADLYDHLLVGPFLLYIDVYNAQTQRGWEIHPDHVSILREAIDTLTNRMIDVELNRVGLTDKISNWLFQIERSGGADVLFRAITALKGADLTRSYAITKDYHRVLCCRLMSISEPEEADTLEDFKDRVAAIGVPENKLVQISLFAPAWCSHVEHSIGLIGLEEAVAWLHLHTIREYGASRIREYGASRPTQKWIQRMSRLTPVNAADLASGAVDVDMFQRVYSTIGTERWDQLYKYMHLVADTKEFKRTKLFVDAMLGNCDASEQIRSIKEKRSQDAVRALGLIPAQQSENADLEIAGRFAVIQEFLRTSKQFGAMRRESEAAAARAGMENLARTAGYDDPMRLEWAMEYVTVADLAEGPASVDADTVRVTLTIDHFGKPQIACTKAGKSLASVPAAAKKSPEVAALLARSKDIERQQARMRSSLESSMCRANMFRGSELLTLLKHPVMSPMLCSLVFTRGDDAGYPDAGTRCLVDWKGQSAPIEENGRYQAAHPWDLLQTGEWAEWQRECFLTERIQPFKQVFRELYVRTDAEQSDGDACSMRYSGLQVNPRQASAILTARGWTASFQECDVSRTYHADRITAWVGFQGGWTTPAEVEPASVDRIWFSDADGYKPIALASIPPRLFSETMRDLDLVVSVAHVGGVDPEYSQSTTEMRARLVTESAQLLKLTNVRLNSTHVMVDGKLGTYSIHLGSGVVHRSPGGHLCIVAVPGQHRGRIFLPFADDDPRTAEIIAKAIMLARDFEIKDPIILEQILGRAE